MSEKSGDDVTKRTIDGNTAMCMALIQLALKSSDERVRMSAIDRIMDRIDGRPQQNVDVDARLDSGSVFDDIDVTKLDASEKAI